MVHPEGLLYVYKVRDFLFRLVLKQILGGDPQPLTTAWCPLPAEGGRQVSNKGCLYPHLQDCGREDPLNVVFGKERGLWKKTMFSSSFCYYEQVISLEFVSSAITWKYTTRLK